MQVMGGSCSRQANARYCAVSAVAAWPVASLTYRRLPWRGQNAILARMTPPLPALLETGPQDAAASLILAHGAGAAMTSPFLEAMAVLLAERGIHVIRFEFAYMVARRVGGTKRPPPKAETLMPEYAAVLAHLAAQNKTKRALYIGGKSMGGRVASMIADENFTAGRIAGAVCLGYPFHPPGQPQTWRTAHLTALPCPTLIVQGERDPFGTRAEVEALTLSPQIQFTWIGDGDHDFGPRGASGLTRKGNLAAAADAVAGFMTKTVRGGAAPR